MRIMQIHKFFYPHAGSETVLFHTRELLMERGHEVIDFAMEHPDNVPSKYSKYFSRRREYIDPTRPLSVRVRDAAATIYSVNARRALRRLLTEARPDVAHLHIVYHQLTMSVVDELATAGVPIVMTLHDYKIGCPAYTLYRDGAPCYECASGTAGGAVRHKCMKGSRAASVLAGAEALVAHRMGKYGKVDMYVCPSRFAGEVAIGAGIDPGRVRVIPNFLPDKEVREPVSGLAERPEFLFAGRLEEVKGLADLLQAFETGPPELGTLVVAGAGGDLEPRVKEATSRAANIDYRGRLARSDALRQLRASRAAVLPSRWNENNPMSILEARSLGIPVIVSDRGGLPEMVTDGVDGLVVGSGDVAGLQRAIAKLAGDADLARRFGVAGRERFLRENTEDAHYAALMGVYEEVLRASPTPASK
jgi:glycosyltransferase involved in cell wall biosynthesis